MRSRGAGTYFKVRNPACIGTAFPSERTAAIGQPVHLVRSVGRVRTRDWAHCISFSERTCSEAPLKRRSLETRAGAHRQSLPLKWRGAGCPRLRLSPALNFHNVFLFCGYDRFCLRANRHPDQQGIRKYLLSRRRHGSRPARETVPSRALHTLPRMTTPAASSNRLSARRVYPAHFVCMLTDSDTPP